MTFSLSAVPDALATERADRPAATPHDYFPPVVAAAHWQQREFDVIAHFG
jgi:hypothetical protein